MNTGHLQFVREESRDSPGSGRSRRGLAPIALFVYKRPQHASRVIDALLKNRLSSDSDLFIFFDGARGPADREAVEQVRANLSEIDGFRSVRRVLRDRNLGLAGSIIAGVTEILASSDRVIVVEDDIVTSPHFLRFMNDALERYEDDDRVISIHGYVYPIDDKNRPPAFFLRDTGCWGWATWRRGWDLFEADGAKLLAAIEQRGLADEFDFNRSYPFTQMLRDQIRGRNGSWAIRFQAAAFLLGKLTLYPGISLVQNIGHDGSGEHCDDGAGSFEVPLAVTLPALSALPVEESREMRQAYEAFFRGLRVPLPRRIWAAISQAIRSPRPV